MKIELDLLENSLDFLKESLGQYIVADEQGTHLSYHSDYQKKIKWKMAFIDLVQATELLMKEIIFKVAPALIQPNIDSFSDDDKSISFSQCITRLLKFTQINITDEEIAQLKGCAKLRNRFTHYDVSISSEEIKIKYSALFSLYIRLYKEGIKKDIHFENLDDEVKSIITFADQYTIYRGCEIRRIDLAEFKKDIQMAQCHPSFVDKNGTTVPRIKFGSGEDIDEDLEEDNHSGYYTPTVYLWDYCDDCGAKQGEYHLLYCDLERCPICGGQAMTCDCELKWADDDKL